MINPDVISNADKIAQSFNAASPFRHAVIDDFLRTETAERSLADFPPFDPAKAVNEQGRIGGKAVHSDLSALGPFYETLNDYLFSTDFLELMSRLTGIEGLFGDPRLYGGGTHENRHGQELDPHVDFNYLIGSNAHRRLNLLIYLNKDWQQDWGGQLELHSDPREPDRNVVTAYPVGFNRAIMFETSEHSWHGFPRINLPEELRETHSRKCLSIYLYTRNRPREEICGSHGTFYVARPIPGHLRPGHTLTDDDVAALKQGFRRRDEYIASYQRAEEVRGRADVGLADATAMPSANLPVRVLGAIERTGRDLGQAWMDGWVGACFEVEMKAREPIRQLTLTGYVSKSAPLARRTIVLKIGDTEKTIKLWRRGKFKWVIPVAINAGETFSLRSTCDTLHTPMLVSDSDDDRPLAYNIIAARFT